MSTISKLDNLIQKSIEEIDVLRNEREVAAKKIINIENELKDAKETIHELKRDNKDSENPSLDDEAKESKKREIIKQINFIIDSIDSLDFDSITYV